MGVDPMEEGKVAAADGKPLSDNPYPAGSDAHEEWAKGWYYFHSIVDDTGSRWTMPQGRPKG